jgi:hypothetical protein
MSGVTPLVDTLLPSTLAQRADLIALKPEITVTGPEPVPDSEKGANDTRLPSRAAVDRKLGTELLDERGAHGALRRLAGSGTLTLSATARAISAILGQAQGETAPAAVRGAAPLWRLAEAPAAHLLAPALARTVAGSGLFYESHLSRYASGKFTLEQLAQEPQARLGSLAKSNPELIEGRAEAQSSLREALAFAALKPALPQQQGVQHQLQGQPQLQAQPQTARMPDPGQPAAGQPAPSPAGHDQVDTRQLNFDQLPLDQLATNPASVEQAVTDQAGMDSSSGDSVVADQSKATPFASAPGASARPSPASVAAAYHTTSLPMSLALRGEGGVGPTNMPSPEAVHNAGHAPAAVVHPEAVALVRQQLDLLAVPVFRWSGEAWPGVKMDWEIQEERDEQHEAHDAAPRVWNTRLNVSLPALGVIEMRLSLADNTLQARLAAIQGKSMALLRSEGETLRERLEVAGLQLTALQVVPLAEQPEAQKDAAAPELTTDSGAVDIGSGQQGG